MTTGSVIDSSGNDWLLFVNTTNAIGDTAPGTPAGMTGDFSGDTGDARVYSQSSSGSALSSASRTSTLSGSSRYVIGFVVVKPTAAGGDPTPADVVATFVIPTPTVKTGIWDVSDRGVRNSTSTGTAVVTLTNPTLIAVGSYLIARVAVDNSGTNGALPGLAITDSRSHTWTLETGANQDPGAASAGASCYLGYVKVVTPFQAADTVTFTWTTGTPRSAIVLEEWAGIDPTTPRAVTSTRANNVSSTAQPTGAITPSAARQLLFVTAAAEQLGTEWGAQDTDTTNGSWVDVTTDSANTGTHDTSMSVYGGTKIVTASGAQTWNNTLSATGDWATVSIVFAPQILENVYAADVLATFVIPTPTVTTPGGTNITATAAAATFTTRTAGPTTPVSVVPHRWSLSSRTVARRTATRPTMSPSSSTGSPCRATGRSTSTASPRWSSARVPWASPWCRTPPSKGGVWSSRTPSTSRSSRSAAGTPTSPTTTVPARRAACRTM
jgi:hypothetical protein